MSLYGGYQPGQLKAARRKIKIWGLDKDGQPFTQFAWTTHIGGDNARLEGVEAQLKLEDVIGGSHAEKKSRFRVLAVGTRGQPNQGMVELQMVAGALDDFWGMEPNRGAANAARSERRSAPRYRCKGMVTMQQVGQDYKVRASISDIALNGCYVELAMPFPEGTKFRISVTVGNVMLECSSTTVTSHPGVGMGVRFDVRNMLGKPELERLLSRLEREVGHRFLR